MLALYSPRRSEMPLFIRETLRRQNQRQHSAHARSEFSIKNTQAAREKVGRVGERGGEREKEELRGGWGGDKWVETNGRREGGHGGGGGGGGVGGDRERERERERLTNRQIDRQTESGGWGAGGRTQNFITQGLIF